MVRAKQNKTEALLWVGEIEILWLRSQKIQATSTSTFSKESSDEQLFDF